MHRLGTIFLLTGTLLAAAPTAFAAAAPTGEMAIAAPEQTVLQATTAPAVLGRAGGVTFLSPDASSPIAHHVMSPHDRDVMRQQIEGTAQRGANPQHAASGKTRN